MYLSYSAWEENTTHIYIVQIGSLLPLGVKF